MCKRNGNESGRKLNAWLIIERSNIDLKYLHFCAILATPPSTTTKLLISTSACALSQAIDPRLYATVYQQDLPLTLKLKTV